MDGAYSPNSYLATSSSSLPSMPSVPNTRDSETAACSSQPPLKRIRLFGQHIVTPASPAAFATISPACSFTSTAGAASRHKGGAHSPECSPGVSGSWQQQQTPQTSGPPCYEEQQQQRASSLSALGDDLLQLIVQQMRPTAWDLCRMACVSKPWRALCYSRQFWTKLRIGPGSMRPGMARLAPRCRNLTDLLIDDPRCELHVLNPIILACAASLRRVVVDCDSIAGGAAAGGGAAGNAPSSGSEASICNLLWLISLHCRNITRLELLSSRTQSAAAAAAAEGPGAPTPPPAGFSNLLESRLMWFLTTAFRNVRHFSCLLPYSVTTQTICLMAIAWRSLASLRLHCATLHYGDLLALRKCGSLRSLEIVGGRLVDAGGTLGGGGSPRLDPRGKPKSGEGLCQLEVLVLNSCEFDSEAVASIAWHAPRLQRIVTKGNCRCRGGSEGSSSSSRSSSGVAAAMGAAPAVGGGGNSVVISNAPATPIPASAAAAAAAAGWPQAPAVGAHSSVAGTPERLVESADRMNPSSSSSSSNGTAAAPSGAAEPSVLRDPFAPLRRSLYLAGCEDVAVASSSMQHVPAVPPLHTLG